MRKNWTKEEDNFLKNNLSMSYEDIALSLNRTSISIKSRITRLNLSKRINNWLDYECDFIKNNYEILSDTKIAKILNKPRTSISFKRKEFGLSKWGSALGLKYPVDLNYFNQWSSDMAYISGFLMADGYVTKEKVFGLRVCIKDYSVIEFIKNKISPTRPIYTGISKIEDKEYEYAQLTITSLEFCKNLYSNINICLNKTGKESLPKIPDEFKNDYLRGYFDGDGCAFYAEYFAECDDIFRKRGHFSIVCSSLEFLDNVRIILGKGFGTIHKKEKNKDRKSDLYEWRVGALEELNTLYYMMYENDNSFCLKRKKDKLYQSTLKYENYIRRIA